MSRPVRSNRHNDGKKGAKAKEALTPVQAIIAEASRLKQAAERRSAGREAAVLFEQSAEKYRAALQMEMAAEQRHDALNDLGEAYLEWSSSLLADLQNGSAAFDLGSADRTTSTHMAMANLCRESTSAYEAILSEVGAAPSNSQTPERASTWLEATVNSGNALAEWADALVELSVERGGGVEKAGALLEQAERRYAAALALQNDDIETLANLGDCLVRHAELQCRPLSSDSTPAEWERARPLYERATEAYGAGCSLADARLGDDLTGLLINWGAGLYTAAQRSPDAPTALKLYSQAEEKLQNAASFSATDVAPRVTLGDALSGHGERAHAAGHVAEAYSLLTRAVDEGYGGALRVDRSNLDAKLGVADVFLLAGKLKAKDGETQASQENFGRSAAAYREALEGRLAGLGFVEWCDAVYNYACAAALAGREEEAASALNKLGDLKRLRADDLAADADFASCRNKDWFAILLSRCAA